MNIALIGYGKMGKRIHALSEDQDIEIVQILDEYNNVDGSGITKKNLEDADVVIDFSHPSAVLMSIKKVLKIGKPMVVGTTGWLDHKDEIVELCQETGGRLLYGSNFSVGVQLFAKLVRRAAELYGRNPMFDSVLHEVHHTQKADAPSGTALTLAEQWLKGSQGKSGIVKGVPEQGKVDPGKLYVTSQRLGSVYGDHQLRINSPYDDIEITHRARTRDAFASGALKAADWLMKQEKPGFYLIEDIVEELA